MGLEMSRQKKRRKLGAGNACPKCSRQMKRFEHGDGWKPKAGQPFWYKYWDICARCRHIQHYECAKVHRDALIEDVILAPQPSAPVIWG
jgi:hypothetical protein